MAQVPQVSPSRQYMPAPRPHSKYTRTSTLVVLGDRFTPKTLHRRRLRRLRGSALHRARHT